MVSARGAGPGTRGPWSRLLATGLPVLIVQGGNDPFGRPGQFPPLPPGFELVEVPFANHTFGVPAAIDVAALATVTGAVTRWLDDLLSHREGRTE